MVTVVSPRISTPVRRANRPPISLFPTQTASINSCDYRDRIALGRTTMTIVVGMTVVARVALRIADGEHVNRRVDARAIFVRSFSGHVSSRLCLQGEHLYSN